MTILGGLDTEQLHTKTDSEQRRSGLHASHQCFVQIHRSQPLRGSSEGTDTWEHYQLEGFKFLRF